MDIYIASKRCRACHKFFCMYRSKVTTTDEDIIMTYKCNNCHYEYTQSTKKNGGCGGCGSCGGD